MEPPYPSLAECWRNDWDVTLYCTRCRRIAVLRAAHELPRLKRRKDWTAALEISAPRFRCTAEKPAGETCHGRPGMLTITRPVGEFGKIETLLRVALS